MKCTLTFFTCGPLGDLEFAFEDDRDLSLRGVTSELIGPDLGELTAAKKLKRWLNSFDPRHTVTFSFSVNCEDAHTMRDGEHFFWVSFYTVFDGYHVKITDPVNNDVLVQSTFEKLRGAVECIFDTFATHFTI